MYGNAWEWVQDWHYNYPNFNEINPEGPASSAKGRRGSWISNELRSSLRKYNSPSHKWNSLGFRVAFKPILIDSLKPEIQLKGDNSFTREAGQVWVEPGVEAHDVRDGNITDQIVVTGSVDMNRTGNYTLTYKVTDAAGNKDTKTRTVTVRGNHTVDLNATVAMDMIGVRQAPLRWSSPATEAGRGTDETEHNVSLTHGFYSRASTR